MSNPIIGQGWQFPPMLDERGTVALTSGSDEIGQAIRIVLSTVPGQRVMRPEFGCRIHELVFAPNNTTTAGLAKRYITEALGRWEPRITLQEIGIEPDPDQPACLMITIHYQINATHNSRSLVYPFYLIPDEGEIAAENQETQLFG